MPALYVAEMLAQEKRLAIESQTYYLDFAQRVAGIVHSLKALLQQLENDGSRIAAYGAAAKGTVLANVARLDPKVIEYVVDRNPQKQGKLLPGVGIPIVSPDVLREDAPDYLLLFVWNLAGEIRQQLPEFDGRFIVPVPNPRIL